MSEPPLRICYVLAYFHPFASGAERQALAQGAELARRGHEVRVVTQAVPRSGLPRDEEIEGVAVHRWIDSVRLGPLFGVSFVAGVNRALRRLKGRYDLVHTHQGLWEAISTGLARSWIGVPTLVQPASSGYYGEAEELARTRGFPVLRRLAIRNTAFAAISADIDRQWRALGVPGDRMTRMASGVDPARFHPGPSAVDGSLPPRPRVLFTGRLHPQKNLDVLLDAWADVVRQVDAHLILLGDGPDRDRLLERTRGLGIAGSVHLPGPVADPSEHLRAADAFVLPSVAEGMSNSLLEAMATGLPCLASEIGGNTDLLGDGPCGLLVPAGDRAAWTDAILRVLRDDRVAEGLGRAASRVIEERYALPVVVDRYERLYRALLAGGRRLCDRGGDGEPR